MYGDNSSIIDILMIPCEFGLWWMEQFSVSLFIYNAFAIMNVIYLALNKPSCTRNKHIINLSKQRWQCEKAYVVYVAKPAYFGKFTRISPGNDSQRKIIEAFRLSKSKPSFEKCNHPCKVEKKTADLYDCSSWVAYKRSVYSEKRIHAQMFMWKNPIAQ